MASRTGEASVTGTVTNAQVDDITLSARGRNYVISVANAENLWITFGDTVAGTPTPAVDGVNCKLVTGRGARVIPYIGTIVKVCGDSATAAEYTVEVIP